MTPPAGEARDEQNTTDDGRSHLVDVDPFDLPDWLGTDEVVWRAATAEASGESRVGPSEGRGGEATLPGELVGAEDAVPCDLWCIDVAYPAPVATPAVRRSAHQAWAHEQVLLVAREGRLTLAIPGTGLQPTTTLEAVGRLAKALGVPAGRYGVLLRV